MSRNFFGLEEIAAALRLNQSFDQFTFVCAIEMLAMLTREWAELGTEIACRVLGGFVFREKSSKAFHLVCQCRTAKLCGWCIHASVERAMAIIVLVQPRGAHKPICLHNQH